MFHKIQLFKKKLLFAFLFSFVLATNALPNHATLDSTKKLKIGVGFGLNYQNYLGFDIYGLVQQKLKSNLSIHHEISWGTAFIDQLNYTSEKWEAQNGMGYYLKDSIVINRIYYLNYSPNLAYHYHNWSINGGPIFSYRLETRGGIFGTNGANEESKYPFYSGYNLGLNGIRRFSTGLRLGLFYHGKKRMSYGLSTFWLPQNIATSDIYPNQQSRILNNSFCLFYKF